MHSDSEGRMSPKEWLAAHPLAEGETLYLVLGAASEAAPGIAYYQQQSNPPVLLPLWRNTPYAGWSEVMPHVVALSTESPFLQWIERTDADDWGWLAVSEQDLETVAAYLGSLTKVLLPSGSEAFFRFWDGSHFAAILQALDQEMADVLPIFQRYLVNGRHFQCTLPDRLPPLQPYPWWQVSQALSDRLMENNPQTLIDNLMQWLKESNPELLYQYPEETLQLKVSHFVEMADYTDETVANRLLDHLAQS